MQFLVIGRPARESGNMPAPELKETLEAELVKSREYYGRGDLRNIWMIAGQRGAVGLFEAESVEAVQRLIEEYPMVKKGYVKHEIVPLTPYAGFQK